MIDFTELELKIIKAKLSGKTIKQVAELVKVSESEVTVTLKKVNSNLKTAYDSVKLMDMIKQLKFNFDDTVPITRAEAKIIFPLIRYMVMESRSSNEEDNLYEKLKEFLNEN